MEKGLGSDPLLCGQVTGETVRVCSGNSPKWTALLEAGLCCPLFLGGTWAEGACGQEGRGRGGASGYSAAVPLPREKVAKAGPD